MTLRIMNRQAAEGVSTVGHALSGATIGVKMTYTCPAGRVAVVRSWGLGGFVGSPTVALQITVGGVAVNINQGSVQIQQLMHVPLNPGDTAAINVTGSTAGSSFDAIIGADEYLAA